MTERRFPRSLRQQSLYADLRSIEQHVKALIARVSPAVVAVEVGYGSGSGVVISEDGLVLIGGHSGDMCAAAPIEADANGVDDTLGCRRHR